MSCFSCYSRLALAMPTFFHAINTCVLLTVSPPCIFLVDSRWNSDAMRIHVLGKIEKRRGKIGFSTANELVHVFPAYQYSRSSPVRNFGWGRPGVSHASSPHGVNDVGAIPHDSPFRTRRRRDRVLSCSSVFRNVSGTGTTRQRNQAMSQTCGQARGRTRTHDKMEIRRCT